MHRLSVRARRAPMRHGSCLRRGAWRHPSCRHRPATRCGSTSSGCCSNRPARASSASTSTATACSSTAPAPRCSATTPAEVLGRNMHELTHHSHADGSHYPDTDCPIFNAFRRGLPCRIDTEVFWRARRQRLRGRVLEPPDHGRHGEVRGAVITFVDITERTPRRRARCSRPRTSWSLRVDERTRELSATRWRSCASCRPGSTRCARTSARASRARCTTSSAACWWR